MSKRKSILVVEDSCTVQEMIRAHLERLGYTVHACASTEMAREILENSEIDFVLSDIVLESKEAKTGYHILKYIRSSVGLKHIPVFMMTDQRNADNAKVTAHRLGANGFLAKPFKMNQLDDLVKNALESPSAVLKS